MKGARDADLVPLCRSGHGTFAYVCLVCLRDLGLICCQAGICILEEAGGATFSGKKSALDGQVDAGLLGKLSSK